MGRLCRFTQTYLWGEMLHCLTHVATCGQCSHLLTMKLALRHCHHSALDPEACICRNDKLLRRGYPTGPPRLWVSTTCHANQCRARYPDPSLYPQSWLDQGDLPPHEHSPLRTGRSCQLGWSLQGSCHTRHQVAHQGFSSLALCRSRPGPRGRLCRPASYLQPGGWVTQCVASPSHLLFIYLFTFVQNAHESYTGLAFTSSFRIERHFYNRTHIKLFLRPATTLKPCHEVSFYS